MTTAVCGVDSSLIHVRPLSVDVLRRSFLKIGSGIVAAGGAGLAGCVGAPDGGGEDAPEEETPEGAETETPTEAETPTETPTEPGTPTETPADGGQVATHFRLGGRVEAWQGREPASIADTENPTLQMEAGQTYRVTWENLDGVPHDFVIQDDQGNALAETEQASEEGQTLSVTFTASEEMSQYVCTIHPQTMVGDVQIGS